MGDPFVFDQIDGDEDAIDAAMEKARKRRKIQSLMTVAAIVHAQSNFEFDEDWDDEEYYND